MRKFIISLFVAGMMFPAMQAEVVECTPGELSSKVQETSITELTVTGEMDARDFAFVAFELKELKVFDISAVAIKGYTDEKCLFANTRSYNADALPNHCFMGKALTSVALPTNLKAIGEGAFASCAGISSITLPASLVGIGDFAFSGCSGLTKVEIPVSVTTLGAGAFAHCSQLSQVQATGLTKIGADAFMDCQSLTRAEFGAGLTEIGAGAFRGCNNKITLVIPQGNSLTTIGDLAFQNAGLESIDFANYPNLKEIGKWAFANTLLTSAPISKVYNADGGVSLFYTTPLAQATIPESSTKVVSAAFAGCDNLASISIPENVTEIGEHAFYDCSAIGNVTIPYPTTKIGNYAFAGCTGMQWIKTQNPKAPAIDENTFTDYSPRLYVISKTAKSNFKADPYWSNFKNIRVLGTLLGDVNTDTRVNTTDASMIVEYITYGSTPNFSEDAADIDAKGDINVADASGVVNMILTDTRKEISETELDNEAQQGNNPTYDSMYLKPASVAVGEESTLSVCLTNTLPYASYQFDLTLPEGIDVVSSEGITLVGERHNSTHSLSTAKRGNSVRVVVTSMKNAEINGEGSAIIKLRIRAEGNMPQGEYTAEMKNVVLAYNDTYKGEVIAYEPENTISSINVSNTPSSIDDPDTDNIDVYAAEQNIIIVGAGANMVAKVYDLGGAEIYSGLDRRIAVSGGAAYIVTINGKSHKVIVK